MPRSKTTEHGIITAETHGLAFGSVVTGKSNFLGRFVVIQVNGTTGAPELLEYPSDDPEYVPSPYASPLSIQPDGLNATGEILEPDDVIDLASRHFAGAYEQITPAFKDLVKDKLQSLNPNAKL